MLRLAILLGCVLALPSVEIDVSPPTSTTHATMTVRSNGRVRSQPTTEAPTVALMSAGAEVEIVNPQAGGGWVQIVLPRHATVWVHGRNLVKTDDERILRVTGDGIHVRADARIQSPVLSRLQRDDLITWSGQMVDGLFYGRRVGDWYGVWVAKLPAFIHGSLLDDKGHQPPAARAPGGEQDGVATATTASAPVAADLERLWLACQSRYETWRIILDGDPETGLQQDWIRLELDLEKVISKHPRVRTRLLAHQMASRIRRLLKQASLLRQRGLPMNRHLAALPPGPGGDRAPKPAPAVIAAPASTPVPAVQPMPTPAPQPAPVDGSAPKTPPAVSPEPASPVAPAAPASVQGDEVVPVQPPETLAADATLEGWLMEEQVPDQAVHHVLKNRDGELIALVKVPPESAVQLADFNWQHVRISGLRQVVTLQGAGGAEDVILLILVGIEKVR